MEEPAASQSGPDRARPDPGRGRTQNPSGRAVLIGSDLAAGQLGGRRLNVASSRVQLHDLAFQLRENGLDILEILARAWVFGFW